LEAPGAESFPELIKRAKRLLEYIHTMHKKGSLLLVTHGDFGKMLYASYYGIHWEEVLHEFHFGNCELLALAKDANPKKPHVIRQAQYNH
jgi:broad specificity phosphatase PhoE